MLYDIEKNRRRFAAARHGSDEVAREEASFGDEFAIGLTQHFSEGEWGTVGRVLILVSAAFAGLRIDDGSPPPRSVMTNIVGFAGERMMAAAEAVGRRAAVVTR